MPPDQTPTPTKFLRNCEEIGLFNSADFKNPFDDAFSKAVTEGKGGKLPTTPSTDVSASQYLNIGIIIIRAL